MTRFTLGEVQLSILDGGALWLDGGAMFGIVPRVLWERHRAPDERHRIRMGLNLLLIQDGKETILVDTGVGDKSGDRERAIYGLDAPSADEVLAPAGIRPDQVDRVINTHLHFDHAGGNTCRRDDGRLEATFANARYFVQRAELEAARRTDNERLRAGFPPDNFEPLLEESGRVELLDGDTAITDHVRVRCAPGHTPGMQLVLVEAGGCTVAFMADLIPTAAHVPYTWIMAFDLEPLTTLETRRRIYPEAIDESWVMVLEHDPEMPLARLENPDGKPRARAWIPQE